MADLTPQQLALLLANCIKQYGKDNVLQLIDQQVLNPMQIRLHAADEDATLVLLEGAEQIKQWDTRLKALEDKLGIPECSGEPDGET